jgi:hypothetical protein
MLTTEPDAVGQGTWAIAINTGLPFNGRFSNVSASADGDNFSLNFRCASGVYTLQFNAAKDGSWGILDIDIDDVEVGSFDLYAGVADYNNVEEVTGISLGRGEHTLKFRIDGKNASSSDYNVFLQGIALKRTA